VKPLVEAGKAGFLFRCGEFVWRGYDFLRAIEHHDFPVTRGVPAFKTMIASSSIAHGPYHFCFVA
jgi:hypothetical protein